MIFGFFKDRCGYKFLFPICGSQIILFTGIEVFNNNSIAFFATLNPPEIPFMVTKLKLSREVWYSGYSPYLVLKIDAIGNSTKGEQYCLSSEPF